MRKLVTGCYAAMLVLSAALPALASQAAPPRYQSSDPSDGATVHQPPDRVEATFDQLLDGSSQLLVQDSCGRRVDGGSTEVTGNTMSTTLTMKPSGDYHVEYAAVGLGGVTGKGRGHFTFTAHGGKPCDGKPNQNHHKNNKNEGTGKNGHNNHNNNAHENKNHENRNQEDGKQGSNEHSDGDDHDTQSASDGGSTHSDQDAAASNGDHDGGQGGKHDDPGSEDDGSVALGDPPGITSNDTSRKLLSRADSGTLLLSLGLCLALGVLGGAILRTSGAR